MDAPPSSRTRRPGGDRRRLGGARALIAVLAAATRVPGWLRATPGSSPARAYERRFFARVARGAGLAIEVRGTPAPAAGTLMVANHISWADIPALGAVTGAGFVAKGEIAGWPLIGRLARRLGCVYVSRDQRARAASQAGEIAARLADGGIILFPEGTTGDGAGLRPFRSSLFAAAASARRVQPVAIAYVDAGGAPLSPAARAEVAWGDEGLAAAARRFARRRRRVVLAFLPPIEGPALADRKALAQAAHAAIARAYADIALPEQG